MAEFDFATLVTNRSREDLETLREILAAPVRDWTAAERSRFNQASARGAYNYTDLNRVTACMEYLDEVLTEMGYVTGYHGIIIPHNSKLPPGYTELEYIRSSGNAWINTGVSGAFSAVFDVQFASSQTRVLMGQSTSVGMYWGKDANNRPELGGGIYLNADLTQRTEIEFEKTASYAILSAGGQSVQRASSTSTSAFLIFRAGGSDAGSYLGTISLYRAEFYAGDQLIREFIPCKNASGQIGLYDTENSQFYSNAGSGAFVAGPEIPGMDPALWYEEDIPTLTQMQRYLGNVSALRGVLELPEDTAAVPEDMAGLTVEEANAIEDILGSIEGWIQGMMQAWFYSGEIYAGEV